MAWFELSYEREKEIKKSLPTILEVWVYIVQSLLKSYVTINPLIKIPPADKQIYNKTCLKSLLIFLVDNKPKSNAFFNARS